MLRIISFFSFFFRSFFCFLTVASSILIFEDLSIASPSKFDQVFTSRGVMDVLIHAPARKNIASGKGQVSEKVIEGEIGLELHPLLIIAPSRRFPFRSSWAEKLGDQASENGFFVVRFNWKTRGFKKPDLISSSEGWRKENADMGALISHYRVKPEVKTMQTFLLLSGETSLAAMRGSYRKARGVLVVGPSCEGFSHQSFFAELTKEEEVFGQLYQPILRSSKRVYFATFSKGGSCTLPQVRQTLKRLGQQRRVTHQTFEGFFQANQDLVDASLNWLLAQVQTN